MFHKRVFWLCGRCAFLVYAHWGAYSAGGGYASDKAVAERVFFFEGIPKFSGLLDNIVPVVAERHFVANALFKALNGVVRIKRFLKRQVFALARVDLDAEEFFELIVH